jgi:hypothetical protein
MLKAAVFILDSFCEGFCCSVRQRREGSVQNHRPATAANEEN